MALKVTVPSLLRGMFRPTSRCAERGLTAGGAPGQCCPCRVGAAGGWGTGLEETDHEGKGMGLGCRVPMVPSLRGKNMSWGHC